MARCSSTAGCAVQARLSTQRWPALHQDDCGSSSTPITIRITPVAMILRSVSAPSSSTTRWCARVAARHDYSVTQAIGWLCSPSSRLKTHMALRVEWRPYRHRSRRECAHARRHGRALGRRQTSCISGTSTGTASIRIIDLAAGGSLAGMVAAIEAALARTTEHTTFVPGHGRSIRSGRTGGLSRHARCRGSDGPRSHRAGTRTSMKFSPCI